MKKKVSNLYTPNRFFFFIEIMTKFNKDLYAKMKAKKNEPLSNIGQRRLKITDKEREKEKESAERGLSTLTLDEGRATSPTISIEEVDLPTKKRKIGEKGKEKMCSNAWTDAGAAMARANELLTPEEMREISSMPSHEIVNQHVHKLVQVASSLFCYYYYYYYFCLLALTVMNPFVRFWERRCIPLPNIWQMRRRPSWPTPKLRC